MWHLIAYVLWYQYTVHGVCCPQEDDVEQLAMGYASFAENKPSKNAIFEYLLHMLVKRQEPWVLEVSTVQYRPWCQGSAQAPIAQAFMLFQNCAVWLVLLWWQCIRQKSSQRETKINYQHRKHAVPMHSRAETNWTHRLRITASLCLLLKFFPLEMKMVPEQRSWHCIIWRVLGLKLPAFPSKSVFLIDKWVKTVRNARETVGCV